MKQIDEDASAGLSDAVWTRVESLLRGQQRDEGAALALVAIVERGHLSIEKALTVLTEVYAAHRQDESVLGLLADALDKARDIDLLNDAPPESPLFSNVVNTLNELSDKAKGGEAETLLLQGLSTAARMMGRQKDDVVERSCRRLIELNPKASNPQYNFGLFLNTRGRFREGMRTCPRTSNSSLQTAPPRPDSHPHHTTHARNVVYFCSGAYTLLTLSPHPTLPRTTSNSPSSQADSLPSEGLAFQIDRLRGWRPLGPAG